MAEIKCFIIYDNKLINTINFVSIPRIGETISYYNEKAKVLNVTYECWRGFKKQDFIVIEVDTPISGCIMNLEYFDFYFQEFDNRFINSIKKHIFWSDKAFHGYGMNNYSLKQVNYAFKEMTPKLRMYLFEFIQKNRLIIKRG